MPELIINPNNSLTKTELEKLSKNAFSHLENARARQTLKSYKSDFEHFSSWCKKNDLKALPCESQTLVLYIESLIASDFKYSTLERRKTSINIKHKEKGFPKPYAAENETLRLWWQGIRKSIGISVIKKKPIIAEDLKKLINICLQGGNEAKLKRDVVILLIGFTGCMRRSEIVALNIEDINFVKEGLEIEIQKSKTDQEGRGIIKRICYASNYKYCTIRQLQIWMKSLNNSTGALFRKINRHGGLGDRLSSQSIALIVKEYSKKAGLNYKEVSGHSLRSGFATTTSMAGASLPSIMRQGNWKSERIALGYIQNAKAWEDNASSSTHL